MDAIQYLAARATIEKRAIDGAKVNLPTMPDGLGAQALRGRSGAAPKASAGPTTTWTWPTPAEKSK